MRKLILHSNLSPGDIVTMTAAVRDLHAAHPGEFLTDVRTPCPALWENNPRVTSLTDGEAEHIHLEYPLIHQSNQLPFHFIHGYRMNLAAQLGIDIPAGPFKGDIHISDEEKGWFSQVREITGTDEPFWIVVAGGKRDFTAKLWDPARWQGVVDQLLAGGKIKHIVQVGEKGHAHPALRNVIDLRGKTDLRQLVRLVYHSSGVICPVTSLMHLAAAVPTKTGGIRPCVVVAGGREPSQWEAYPGHRYIDTIGALPCCSNGGCWKSRVAPLGDGEKHDESLCVRPVKSGNAVIPQCLQMITVNHVVEAVKSYLVTPANEKPIELAKQPAKSCCGQPSAAKVAGNAAKAAGRAIGAFLTGKPVLVETDVRNARLTVCHSCDRFDPKKNRCSECGCYVNGKTKLATENCPLGKWPGDDAARLGVVVGTYAAVPYIHLQLEARRRFHPNVPYLIVDDCSPKKDELAALCAEYGADFISRTERIGHWAGDMQVFLAGLQWANQRGIQLLAKFSRRWIPLKRWTPELTALWKETESPTFNAHCEFHGFGFRSECVGMSVPAWSEHDALRPIIDHMATARRADPLVNERPTGHALVEHIIHLAAIEAWKHRTEKTEAYAAKHPRREDADGYVAWPLMGSNRRQQIPGVLWHESSPPSAYLDALRHYGITRYSAADFPDKDGNLP